MSPQCALCHFNSRGVFIDFSLPDFYRMLAGCINGSHVKERDDYLNQPSKPKFNKIYVCDLIKTVKLICRDKLLVFDAVMRVEPWIEGKASREVTGILFSKFSVAQRLLVTKPK